MPYLVKLNRQKVENSRLGRSEFEMPTEYCSSGSGILVGTQEVAPDYSREVLSVVSGVRRRGAAGEQGKADRRRIPDTTT
jgi:hypothetical protein